MSALGDFLKKSIREKMEFHKRSASGESVETLREELRGDHLLIWGVDYWDEINNGIPEGTDVSLSTLSEWVNNRSSRYPNRSDWGVGGWRVQNNIFMGEAAINQQPERLQIIKQVTDGNQSEITRQASDLVSELLKLR